MIQSNFFNNKNKVYVVLSNASEHNNNVIKIINYFKSKKGLLITFNKPHQYFDFKNLFFIDGSGSKKCDENNCVYIDGPQALTELSITLSQLINSHHFDVIILDSLFTMLTYNDNNLVEQFIHYFINKMRELGVNVIITSINDKDSTNTHNILCQLADKCSTQA